MKRSFEYTDRASRVPFGRCIRAPVQSTICRSLAYLTPSEISKAAPPAQRDVAVPKPAIQTAVRSPAPASAGTPLLSGADSTTGSVILTRLSACPPARRLLIGGLTPSGICARMVISLLGPAMLCVLSSSKEYERSGVSGSTALLARDSSTSWFDDKLGNGEAMGSATGMAMRPLPSCERTRMQTGYKAECERLR